ncbi:MAG: phosphotyrosine protein phosphatase [Nanoarchaeota archaeon]
MKTNLLFLCSANMDRSPCAEALFENSLEFEAKSAGLSELTENPVTNKAIDWADIILVMDERNEGHKSILLEKFPKAKNKDIRILNISNEFSRYDKELERLLRVILEKEGIEV